MSAVEHDDGWYQRMAERSAAREGIRDAEHYANSRNVDPDASDVLRCTYCGEPLTVSIVFDGTGRYHFGHTPGAKTMDLDSGRWYGRDGNIIDEQ